MGVSRKQQRAGGRAGSARREVPAPAPETGAEAGDDAIGDQAFRRAFAAVLRHHTSTFEALAFFEREGRPRR